MLSCRNAVSQHSDSQYQPKDKLILTTHARFQAVGYALLTGDDPNQELTSTRETYTTVVYALITFSKKFGNQRIYTNFGQHQNQSSLWPTANQ